MHEIKIVDATLAEDEVEELQWACDAFVSLHRSEGFGLWIAECMAKGKPCIVTNYSGNVDFCSTGNCVPVGFTMVPVRKDQYPHGEGRWWADPDEDEAIEAMRSLHAQSDLRHQLGKVAQQTIADKLSLSGIGKVIARRLYEARAESIRLPELVVLEEGLCGSPSAAA